jgi:hypothetical protein
MKLIVASQQVKSLLKEKIINYTKNHKNIVGRWKYEVIREKRLYQFVLFVAWLAHL